MFSTVAMNELHIMLKKWGSLKVPFTQRVEVDFLIAQNECRKTSLPYYPILKMKILTFFALTVLIDFYIIQLGFRSISN